MSYFRRLRWKKISPSTRLKASEPELDRSFRATASITGPRSLPGWRLYLPPKSEQIMFLFSQEPTRLSRSWGMATPSTEIQEKPGYLGRLTSPDGYHQVFGWLVIQPLKLLRPALQPDLGWEITPDLARFHSVKEPRLTFLEHCDENGTLLKMNQLARLGSATATCDVIKQMIKET